MAARKKREETARVEREREREKMDRYAVDAIRAFCYQTKKVNLPSL